VQLRQYFFLTASLFPAGILEIDGPRPAEWCLQIERAKISQANEQATDLHAANEALRTEVGQLRKRKKARARRSARTPRLAAIAVQRHPHSACRDPNGCVPLHVACYVACLRVALMLGPDRLITPRPTQELHLRAKSAEAQLESVRTLVATRGDVPMRSRMRPSRRWWVGGPRYARPDGPAWFS
jgi:outer membrane murein-binding lipoprotein Lpp